MKRLSLMLIILVSLHLQARASQSGDDLFYKKTIDLGLSSGTFNNVNYTEVDLGLNLYLSPNLDIRNAVFNRIASEDQNFFGLDTSVRGVYSSLPANFGFTTFAGPGARIPSKGSVTPFAEGGLILSIAGFGVGAGAKLIANSWVNKGMQNETQVFIILAGSGAL